jgi:hypothetical protein
MTVSSTTTKSSHSGNGVLDTFAYAFKIFADDDLVVIIRTNSTGAEATKTKTTHYTVTGVGSASGGNVVFTSGNIPASGETVVIKRSLTLTQATDYVANDPFPADSHEDALDRLTMIAQQQQEVFDRAVVLPATDTASTTIPNSVTRASKYLAFDSSGNLTAAAGTADVTPIGSVMESVVGASTLNTARTELLSGTNISVNTANTITTLNSNGDLTLTPNGTGTVIVSTDLDVDNININGNTISSTDTNGNITLDPNGTGSVAITSANLVLTSGNGIDFSATADSSGTAASEVFDDYEEGSFTPTWASGLTSISYTSQVGRYVKIGTFVYCQILLDASSATKASSQVKIGGLPFTSANVTNSHGSGVCAATAGGFDIGDGVVFEIQSNDTELIWHSQSGADYAGTSLSDQNAPMKFTATYISA